MSVKPGLFAELEARGLVKQTTDPSLARALDREPLTLYAGFDPTADSLHLGHLLPLLTLRRFQEAGHRPIAVAGGATGMIGDPSGKSQERSLLNDELLQKNLKGMGAVISRVLESSGRSGAKLLNNADWFKGVSYIDFLRDIGKHFTVNHMVAKESVRARLEDREHGISYTEFSYMLLQAYDFWVLHQTEGCRLQIGGSDQWGNITAGIDLIRKILASRDERPAQEVFGLTLPLVTKADGGKFGKTESGTVWLSAEKTSPYQFYQYLIQTADADAVTYLKYFTFLSLEKIAELESSLKSAPEKREAPTALARELTRIVHGDLELARAEKASKALFGTEIRQLDGPTLLSILSGAPSMTKSSSALAENFSLVDALAESGLCSSKGAARKEIAAGGIYVNNERVSDPLATLKKTDLIAGKYLVLRKGKKSYYLYTFN